MAVCTGSGVVLGRTGEIGSDTQTTCCSVSHYSVWKFHSQSMDKLKKALSGDDDDEESGIVTQVKRKSYLWMLSFINFAEIEMIVNDVSCGLKIEQSTCTAFINLLNII